MISLDIFAHLCTGEKYEKARTTQVIELTLERYIGI